MIRNMKYRIAKTWETVLWMLSLLFIFILLSESTAFAQEIKADVSLKVMQEFTISNVASGSVDTKGSYELTALEEGCPMPAGSTDGKYNFTLKDNEQSELLFRYMRGGQYKYQLRQTTEDAGQYHYDRTIYTISVYVKNGDNGQLIPLVIVENAHGEKCENILFQNSYTGKESTTDDGSDEVIETGDKTNVKIYIAMLVMAFATVCITVLIQKKNRKKS